MAGYKKKRARELKHDRFRDTTMGVVDRVANRLEGQGRNILYGAAAVAAVIALVFLFRWWSDRRAADAEQALGKAIEVAGRPVTPSPSPGSTVASFPTEKDRAEKAVAEFQKVADKYGNPYHDEALYFAANNLLIVDRNRGLAELEKLGKSSDRQVGTLARFALAQAREADGQYDAAAAIYVDLMKENSGVLPAETLTLRLASVYEKQGKKKEAADLLFTLVQAARQAKDQDGKPAPQSAAARDAAQELEKLDPARYAQLPPEPPAGNPGF